MSTDAEGSPREPELIDADSLDFGLAIAFNAKKPIPGEGVAAAIERMTGGASRVLLRDDADGPSPILRRLPGSAERLGSDGRYVVMGEIARGGLGIVLKGRDRDLGRDVALKVLRPEFAKNDAVLARFIEEAQIGGQLQHPGIVPVYSLGIEPDGRPFFAMKLVKGRTLSALLVDRKSPRDGQRRLLAVFEQVCRTMAYAHSRRVVHRDLKPSNVMLGAFGEIQVVDWGLAKVLGREDVPSVRPAETRAPEISLIATVRSGSAGSESLAGSVLGTPGYMSPEQALGRVEDVDERTDVFALGAILCEILTGQPPFTGEARDQILLAARGNLEDATARLAKCNADPGIVAVALKCLAAERGDRFPAAGAVVDAVSAHLSGIEARARRAEVAAVLARTKAEEERTAAAREQVKAKSARSAQRRTMALAAVVLIGVAAGIVAWVRDQASESERAARAVSAVSAALADANAKRGAKDLVGALAAAQKAVALAKTGGADADISARAARLLADVEAEDRTAAETAAHAAKLAPLLDRLRGAHSKWSPAAEHLRSQAEHVAAFRDCGIDIESDDVEQSAADIRSSPCAADIAAEIEWWAWDLKKSENPAPGDEDRYRHLCKVAAAADPDPWRMRFRDARDREDVEAMRVVAAQADAAALPVRSLNLLILATEEADPKAALELSRAAVRRHPDDWMSQLSLHAVHLDVGVGDDRDPGEECSTEIAMLAMRPPTHRAWEDVGETLNAWRDPEGALSAFREALRIQDGCYRSLAGLALALDAGGNHAGAKEALDRATEAVEARLKKGTVMQYPYWAHFSQGRVLSAASDHLGAAAAFRRALEIAPSDTEIRDWLTGELLLLRDFEGAAAQAREMIRLAPRWTGGYQRLFEALTECDDADADALLAEVNRATEMFPKSAFIHEWHADALFLRASQTWSEKDKDAAAPEYATAIAACRRYLEQEPKSYYLHAMLATLLGQTHPSAESVAEARIASRLIGAGIQGRYRLGSALYQYGEPEAAADEFEAVLGLGGESADVHVQLSMCRSSMGDTAGELAHARRAVALAPESFDAHVTLSDALRSRSSMREEDGWAEAALETRKARDLYAKQPRRTVKGSAIFDGFVVLADRLADPSFPEKVRNGLKPSSRENANDLVSACSNRDLNVPGVGYAVDALADDARIGDDESIELRVNAACMSVLAADGQGDGAAGLDAPTREAWRRRALAWLREVLPVYAARVVGDDPKKAMSARGTLRDWTRWKDLAPVRTPEGLAKLSIEDRVAWDRFWAEVDRALRSWSSRRK
jgi:serine/threonine-protein kinase